MDIENQKILSTFKSKILGIRNYKSSKNEFFIDDFLDLKFLDSFIGEASNGESDITPAGKSFIEVYYGLTNLAEIILVSEYRNQEQYRDRLEQDVKCLEYPMETITFIEQARGNLRKDFSLREDLLPPADYK